MDFPLPASRDEEQAREFEEREDLSHDKEANLKPNFVSFP
jgi:hypothetical protein